MILTAKARYAVMAIIELASNKNTCPITLSQIAKKQDISLFYLEQIFASCFYLSEGLCNRALL